MHTEKHMEDRIRLTETQEDRSESDTVPPNVIVMFKQAVAERKRERHVGWKRMSQEIQHLAGDVDDEVLVSGPTAGPHPLQTPVWTHTHTHKHEDNNI